MQLGRGGAVQGMVLRDEVRRGMVLQTQQKKGDQQ